jgi:hypothetical protein
MWCGGSVSKSDLIRIDDARWANLHGYRSRVEANMTRELVIGSTIGALGLFSCILGVQGYFNPNSPLLPMFADAKVALGAVVIGLIGCMIEARILIPVLKEMAKRQAD